MTPMPTRPTPWMPPILPGHGPRPHRGVFLAALLLAPVAVGVGGCWLVIPFFATIFGAPAYLLLGTPALWLAAVAWHRGLPRRRLWLFPLAAFLANFGTFPLYAIAMAASEGDSMRNTEELALMFTVWGAAFAPLWGLVMGAFYSWFLPRRLRAEPAHDTAEFDL